MLHQSLKLTASTMMIAIVGAVSVCLPDNFERAAADPTMPRQALRQPGSFVRTVPVQTADERPVTPTQAAITAPD